MIFFQGGMSTYWRNHSGSVIIKRLRTPVPYHIKNIKIRGQLISDTTFSNNNLLFTLDLLIDFTNFIATRQSIARTSIIKQYSPTFPFYQLIHALFTGSILSTVYYHIKPSLFCNVFLVFTLLDL